MSSRPRRRDRPREAGEQGSSSAPTPSLAASFGAQAPVRQTAHELVREHLRRAILSSAVPGGTRLIQAEVALQLGVSTTPVREALRDLATEGLVDFDPHRGAVVHELDHTELIELYGMRAAVEPLVLRSAAQGDLSVSLAAASAIQDQLELTSEPTAWAELNWRFHGELTSSASRRLRAIVKTLQDVSALYVARSVTMDKRRMLEGNAEHRQILVALRAGDVDTAAGCLERHLASTVSSMLESDGVTVSKKARRRA